MKRVRVIPMLLLDGRKLVKSIQFGSPTYVGDPINVLRIFNEKEVDEICVVDISATKGKKTPDLNYIRILASECFMPLSYGGGITTAEQAKEIFKAGVEKIILGTAAFYNPALVREISAMAGSQSVVISIDYKKTWLGRSRVYIMGGQKSIGVSPLVYAKQMEALGAGEILLQNIEREGTLKGYDLEGIREVSGGVNIPVVASGGASSINDFLKAIEVGASAVSAGYMFVYKGPNRAVLVNYPEVRILCDNLYNKI